MYGVWLCREGGDEEYIGESRSLRAARRLAAAHGRGEVIGTPQCVYATAAAARHDVPGCSAPPASIGEVVAWCGRGGYYAICRIVV